MSHSISELNGTDRSAFTAALGSLFEHSPWVAEEAFGRRPFRDAGHLYAELCGAMRRASPERQLDLIRAHPDLAGRLARAGGLTPQSTREQAAAGLDGMETGEMAEFQRLNAAYRERFGFPFVICARLNDRRTIREAMERRMGSSPEQERETALSEIEKIAWLRLQDALKD